MSDAVEWSPKRAPRREAAKSLGAQHPLVRFSQLGLILVRLDETREQSQVELNKSLAPFSALVAPPTRTIHDNGSHTWPTLPNLGDSQTGIDGHLVNYGTRDDHLDGDVRHSVLADLQGHIVASTQASRFSGACAFRWNCAFDVPSA